MINTLNHFTGGKTSFGLQFLDVTPPPPLVASSVSGPVINQNIVVEGSTGQNCLPTDSQQAGGGQEKEGDKI